MSDDFRYCSKCGCHTNAKRRSCCEDGRLEDEELARLRAEVARLDSAFTGVKDEMFALANQRDAMREQVARLEGLLVEWLEGDYDAKDYLSRVKLAIRTSAALAQAQHDPAT